MEPNNMEETTKKRKKLKTGLPKVFDGTYFVVKHMTEDKILAICRTCNKELSGSTTSTGNFFSHIKRLHPEILSDCKSYINGSLPKTSLASSSDCYFPQRLDNVQAPNHELMNMHPSITPKIEMDDQSANSSYCDDDNRSYSQSQKPFMLQPIYSPQNSTTFLPVRNVLNFLLSELLPLSMMGNKGIHNLFQDQVPPMEIILDELNSTFNQLNISVSRFLSNQTVSIIVDISPNDPRKIIAVLATVLDDYFQRKNILLGVKSFSNSENFDNVANVVATILSSFDVSLDNVSNIVYGKGVSFNSMKYQLNDYLEIVPEIKKHSDFEKVKGFRSTIQSCVFLLDLAYQDAIEHMSSSNEIQTFQVVTNKLRTFWAKFKADDRLQEYLDVPVPTNLHWRNIFQPICFLLKHKHQIDNFIEQLNIDRPLTPDDWSYLEDFSNLMTFVHQASMILENELCLGYVLPTILSLITKIKDKQTDACRFFQCGILFGIQNRFSNILNFESPQNIDFLVATISHPKFKMIWAPLEQYNYLVDIFTNECQHLFTKAPQDSTSNDFFFDFTSTPSWSFVREEINDYLQNRNYTISCLHGFPTIKKMFLKSNTTLPGTEVLGDILKKTEQKIGYVGIEELQKMVFINENRKYF